jgi:hypothetical protein
MKSFRGLSKRYVTVCSSPVKRSPKWIALVLSFCSVPLILWINRRVWFYGDDWDFIVGRFFRFKQEGYSISGLLEPHNEHWVTLPLAVHTATQELFGVRTRLPYVVLLSLSHAVVVFCSVLITHRTSRNRAIAVSAGIAILFLSSGFENLVWTFQIGFIGSVALGLVLILLIDEESGTFKRDLLALITAVMGLATNGTSITFVLIAAAVLVSRRQWLKFLRVVVPALTIFGLWYVTFGNSSTQTHPSTSQRLDLPSYVWRGISTSLDGIFHIPGIAAALVLLVGIAFGRPRVSEVRLHLPLMMALGGVFFFSLNAWTRLQFGVDQAASSRYLYVGVVVFTPVVACALYSLIEDRARLRALVVAVSIWIAVSGLLLLERDHQVRAANDVKRLNSMLSAVHEYDESVDPNTIYPSPEWDTKLNLASLLLLNKHNMLPPQEPDQTSRLDIRLSHFLTLTGDPTFVPNTAYPISGSIESSVTHIANGCARAMSPDAPLDVSVKPYGAEPFLISSELGGTVDISLQDGESGIESATTKPANLTPNQSYSVSGWGANRIVRFKLAPGFSLTVCGVTQ